MMRRVLRFSPGKTALTSAVLYAILGLIALPFIYFMQRFTPAPAGGPAFGFGVGLMLGLPIFYGILGYITTYIGCLLYNWVAGFTGGIEVEVADALPDTSV